MNDPEAYILKEAGNYDFPEPLHTNLYHEPTTQQDVIQVYMRAHTDQMHRVKDKFAFEVAIPDDAQHKQGLIDIFKSEVNRGLEQLYETWLKEAPGVRYRGVPYSMVVRHDSFMLRCEQCHVTESREWEDIDVQPQYWDALMCYLLKELDCDCAEEWQDPPYVTDTMLVPEGTILPRL